jgi:hypothetical protein
MSYRFTLALAAAAAMIALPICLWRHYFGEPPAAARPAALQVPWVKSEGNNPAAMLDPGQPVAAARIEEARKHLADVKRKPEERAQAAFVLASAKDWKGVDTLIDQLNDSSPLVRGRSAAAIRHILGTNFYYRAEDDPAKRAAAIADIKRYWKARQTNPPLARQ